MHRRGIWRGLLTLGLGPVRRGGEAGGRAGPGGRWIWPGSEEVAHSGAGELGWVLTRSNEEEKGARSTRASGRFIPEEAEDAGRGRCSAALLRADRDDGDGLACLRRRREADPIGDGRIREVGDGSRRIRRRSRAAAGSQRRTPWRWRRGALQGKGER